MSPPDPITIPVELPADRRALSFSRADIVLENVEQGGPSFGIRIFVGHPHANINTPSTPDNGYAGSVYIYGYGHPPDEPGNQPVVEGVRAPMTRYVTATEAIKEAASRRAELTITLVPVPLGGADEPALEMVNLGAIQAHVIFDHLPA